MGNPEDEFDDAAFMYGVEPTQEEEKPAVVQPTESVVKVEPAQDVPGSFQVDFGNQDPVKEQVPVKIEQGGDASSTQTINDLRCMLEEKYLEISSLKSALASKQSSLDAWNDAFSQECKGGDPNPDTVKDILLSLRASDKKLQEELKEYKKRENALVFRVSAKEQELQEMKTTLQDCRQLQLPENTQVHRLLLDPALHREFMRLQAEAEQARVQLRAAQEEVEAVKYTPESKNGRRLRARLQMWQKENEELAAQVSEGAVHHLESELALLKGFLTDLKALDQQLLEDAELLEIENMELHQVVFNRPTPTQQESKFSEGSNRDKPLHSPPRRHDRRDSKRSRT